MEDDIYIFKLCAAQIYDKGKYWTILWAMGNYCGRLGSGNPNSPPGAEKSCATRMSVVPVEHLYVLI